MNFQGTCLDHSSVWWRGEPMMGGSLSSGCRSSPSFMWENPRARARMEVSVSAYPDTFILFYFIFFLCATASAAYGSSWSRSQIIAAAEATATATATPDPSRISTCTTACGNTGSLTNERGQGSNLCPQGHYVRLLTC